MITIPMIAKYGRTVMDRMTLTSMIAVLINSRFARARSTARIALLASTAASER